MNLLLLAGIFFYFVLGINAKIPISAKFSRVRCVVYNKELVANVTCSVKPISRNTTIANLSGYTRQVNDVMLHLKMYRRANVFKPWLVDVKEDFCRIFSQQHGLAYAKILQNLVAPYSNINHSCPYNGFVFVRDMPLDANRLRDILPAGEYRLDLFLHLNKAVMPTLLIQVQVIFEEKFLIGK